MEKVHKRQEIDINAEEWGDLNESEVEWEDFQETGSTLGKVEPGIRWAAKN